MDLLLGYDIETTGMPLWGKPSGGKEQPHIVQLAATLLCKETGQTVQSMDVIVKPEGYVIPQEMTDIHGISTEQALDVGISESLAVEMLIALADKATNRIAFNEPFDRRVTRIALKRYEFDDATIDKFNLKDDCIDPMRMYQKIFSGKVKKLTEIYEEIIGEPLVGAHSAMADTVASNKIYFSLRDQYHEVLQQA